MFRTVFSSRLLSLLIVLALICFGVTAFAQDSIAPGTPVEGNYTGERQAFTIDLTAGQLLLVSMESEDFDSLVFVQQDGVDLARDDDGGEGLNSLLPYVVQADGTYDIVADAAFFSIDEGAFTLAVDVLDPPIATIDETATLAAEADGSGHLYAVFEGSAGSVVNVWASTTGSEEEDTAEDVSVRLVGPDALQIDSDDDDGAGDNALIRRAVLPSDGMYLVDVEHSFSDEPLLQDVDVMVEATEQIFLDPTPQELVLGDGEGQKGTEVYTVETVAGNTYRFIVTVEPVPDEIVGIDMELLDTDRFFVPSMEARHTTGVTWDFVANEDATIRLDVHPNFFANDVEVINYTIALQIISE